MHNSKQLLLALVTCCYSITLMAQVTCEVEIHGISNELADNVRLFLSIEQQKNHSMLSEARLRRLHKKATKEISSALQPFGYYRPKIDAQLRQTAEGQWLARYSIDPGPALFIKQLNFSLIGDMLDDPAFSRLIEKRALREGSVFNHVHYEDLKASLAKLAAERGYFKARFVEHRVEINLDAYEARIYLHYDGGPRYRFGDVAFSDDVLNLQLLRRYLTFTKGSPYSVDKLIDLQQALNDSDYFQSVEVSPGTAATDTTEIPIIVKLSPRKRHRYSFGIGYGTDSGSRAKFGWERPLLNSRGHRFSIEAKVSEKGYDVNTHYRVPVMNPRTDQIIYSTGVVNVKTKTSESTLRTIGSSLNRGRGSWRESFSIIYQSEAYAIAGDSDTSTLLLPSVHWSRTWGSQLIHTFDGLRFDIGLRGASKKIISDTNFYQFQGGIKAIYPLWRSNRVIARGRLGDTETNSFQQLPASVRFFAGGAQSVRGYAYQSLGPIDDNGNVVGGKHLMIGSIEFEHSLNGKWGLAVFFDAGNATNNISDKLARAAGFGIRWQSPVGPIRIDLGNALSQDNHPWRLHINIGPDL